MRPADAGLLMAVASAPPGYPRVWLTSDVHTDRAANMQWLKALPDHGDDVLLLAGDVSANLGLLEETLTLCTRRFGKVFFTPGNHELWITKADEQAKRDSMGKIHAILALCVRLGVATGPELLGSSSEGSSSSEGESGEGGSQGRPGLWIVPLISWYDLSLDLVRADPSLAVHARHMEHFAWSDFAYCTWGPAMSTPMDTMTGAYPAGVAKALAALNEPAIAKVNAALRRRRGDAIISFSHFLPRRETLPDWVEPEASTFDPGWLAHGAGSTAVKFSKVAGSTLIEDQLRRLTEGVPSSGDVSGEAGRLRHIHAFGHSHRPKDFLLQGVRYVSHPLGYGKEREALLVPRSPTLKLLWDVGGPPPPRSRPLVRFWEECGGLEPELDAMLLEAARPASRGTTSAKGVDFCFGNCAARQPPAPPAVLNRGGLGRSFGLPAGGDPCAPEDAPRLPHDYGGFPPSALHGAAGLLLRAPAGAADPPLAGGFTCDLTRAFAVADLCGSRERAGRTRPAPSSPRQSGDAADGGGGWAPGFVRVTPGRGASDDVGSPAGGVGVLAASASASPPPSPAERLAAERRAAWERAFLLKHAA